MSVTVLQTAFSVPAACFHPLLFQMEQEGISDEETSLGLQPDFQFVIEIPDGRGYCTSSSPSNAWHHWPYAQVQTQTCESRTQSR